MSGQTIVRSFVSNSQILTVDGVACGFLREVSGGGVTAEVVAESGGPGQFVRKHLAGIMYEPLDLRFGFAMGKDLFDWIARAMGGSIERRTLEVIEADVKLDARSSRQFVDARVTEVGFPACDGSSKEPGFVRVRVAPETTRFSKASGKVAMMGQGEKTLFLPSNFRLKIGGLDTTRVNRIGPITIPIAGGGDEKSEIDRGPAFQIPQINFPNLEVTLSEISAESWFQWHRSFVIEGKCMQGDEKDGTLEFLSTNRQAVLGTLQLKNLGIFKVGPDDTQATDTARRVKAEMYCEEMVYVPGVGLK